MSIEYNLEPDLATDEFIDLLERSTLAERRPVQDVATIAAMLRGASVIVTARQARELVGVSRAISDGVYCTYLSDLAVDQRLQRQGIGRELIKRTHLAAGPNAKLILLAAPKAESYYPHIGMQPHSSCWVSDAASTYVELPTAAPHTDSCWMPNERALGHEPGGVNSQPALPPGTVESVGKFFDSIAHEYGAAIHRCFPRYAEMLWAMLEYLPPMPASPRILELGCGTGNFSVLLAEKFPHSELTLIDVSPESLETCASRLRNDQRFKFLACDMRELEFAPGAFDLIVSTIAIHHLTSKEKSQLFASCFAWLSPGGAISYADQFAGATPAQHERHMENWKRISMEAGASRQEWEMWMEHQRVHDHHDSLEQQLTWLADAGFQQLDCPWRYLLWTILQGRKPSH